MYFSILTMVAMETGHFLKMLNDASLASLGFLMWKVLGCIICKNPLWVLSCKVGPKIPVWLPDYMLICHGQEKLKITLTIAQNKLEMFR